MTRTVLLVGVAAVGATGRLPADDPRPDARAAVRRSLPVFEAGGMAWMQQRGCASCHHVPFLLWTRNEARRRGLPVDADKLAAWTDWTLVSMFAAGKDDAGGLETIAQVLLGRHDASPWRRKPSKHFQSVDPFEVLWSYLVDKQKPEGSFPSDGQRPFPEEMSTGWAVLALASRGPAPVAPRKGLGPDLKAMGKSLDERIPKSRERAWQWLGTVAPDGRTEALALRLLVADSFGDADRARAAREELAVRQRPDGGWASRADGPAGDALATGQVLYAWHSAGAPREPLVSRARQFLLTTQRADGAWHVPTSAVHSDPKDDAYRQRTDEVYSYWGTAWATIGLLHGLPAPGVGAAAGGKGS